MFLSYYSLFEVKILQNEFMESFLKMPRRLPFRGFLGGSFGNFVENKGFRCNIAFKCLNAILGVLKHVKLVTERDS